MSAELLKARLDAVWRRYHHRQYVDPDPLKALYDYPNREDREIVGLLAAGLAYGRVQQILRSLDCVLDVLGPQPRGFLDATPARDLPSLFAGFKHRWTTGEEVAAVLRAVQHVNGRHGSLGNAFLDKLSPRDTDVMPALTLFCDELRAVSGPVSLLADPAGASACKRLHLYLRWMIRCDDVDPGGWQGIGTHRLLVPLDTHMHRLARTLGLTQRRSADRRTVEQITAGFRQVAPDDPVRYDFALTRLGIHPEANQTGLPEQWTAAK